MVATLTQLPRAGTPPTSTPYPTSTPRPTLIAVNTPTAVESAGISERTLTASPTGPTITPASCPPFPFDTDLPHPDTPEQYIGRHYDSVNPPAGINGWSAGLLADDSYSWAHVSIQNREVYWVQKMVCRDSSGKAYWEIVDALVLPKLDPNADEVSTDLCFSRKKRIPFVIAYGAYDPAKPSAPVIYNFIGWPMQVKNAWEIDEKFVPLETENLTCLVQEPQNSH